MFFFLDGEVNKPSGLVVSVTKEKRRGEGYGGSRYGKGEKRVKKSYKWQSDWTGSETESD